MRSSGLLPNQLRSSRRSNLTMHLPQVLSAVPSAWPGPIWAHVQEWLWLAVLSFTLQSWMQYCAARPNRCPLAS